MYEGTKHSSASAAERRGVRLEVIQQALGHADARSTARYARLAPMTSVTVLRPECNLSAQKITSSKQLETLGEMVGRAGIEPATSAV